MMVSFPVMTILLALFSPAKAFCEPQNAFGSKPWTRNTPTQFTIATHHPDGFAVNTNTNYPRKFATTSLGSSFIEEIESSPTISTSSLALPLWHLVTDGVLGLLQIVAGTVIICVTGVFNIARGVFSLVGYPSWSELTGLQRVGEVSFLALLLVAFLQGGLAVFQYRTNPSGELMIPPGLTMGTEVPEQSLILPTSMSPPQAATSIRSGSQTKSAESKDGSQFQKAMSSGSAKENGQLLSRINRLLVVLLPWLAARANFVLQRNAHLLHIGSILTLTSILEVPQSFLQGLQQSKMKHESSTALSLFAGEKEHVLVIGDSLAVGLGSVDHFDTNKTNDWPFQRIENIDQSAEETKEQPGPAFPQSLAQTLAKRLQKPVFWRSAGVDGGDIPQIRKFCLGVIDEEVQAGRTPDVVVILCGANDMKYFMSNPFKKSNMPRSFRSKLTSLIEEIRSKAPGTTIIVPALPTQMFHKNSPVNVFPLGLLLDVMVGFWDSQKKLVVNGFNTKGVQYIGLSPSEVNRWYQRDEDNVDESGGDTSQGPITLIAMDGIHPNFRCYTKWASAIGTKLLADL